MRRNVAIQISYDGSCFHGWQLQNNAYSVQEALESGWRQLTGEKIRLIGSSRTDAGVHARALIANYETGVSIPTEKIHLAWNTVLPEGVAVEQAVEVPDQFQARFDAVGKHYSYYYFLSKTKPTYLRNYTAFITDDLRIELMRKACSCLIGEKDFSALMDQGTPVKSTVRHIHAVRIEQIDERILRLDVLGNGFLYHMVRIIAGTLYYIGNAKIDIHELPDLIDAGDRTKLGKTMPPNGLFLNRVFYREKLFGQDDQKAYFELADRLQRHSVYRKH